jgi:hypothetical protein
MSEHDFEPIRGLPGPLPEGETILWQGAPNWRVLASQAFHVRAVAIYFGGMLAWRTLTAIGSGETPARALESALSVAPIALAAIGMLVFLAWLNARTTVYTITNRRLVFRFGAALPKAINFPFKIIDSAALKPIARGCGDVAVSLKAPNKIAFLLMWPHVRPWRVAAPQPTLRGVSDAAVVADILASAMARVSTIETSRDDLKARTPKPAPADLARPETMAA